MLDFLKRTYISHLYLPVLTLVYVLLFVSRLNVFSNAEMFVWPENLKEQVPFLVALFFSYLLLLLPYFWTVLKDERKSIFLAIPFSGLIMSFLLGAYLTTWMIWISILAAFLLWIKDRRLHIHWIYLALPLLFLIRLVYMWIGGETFSRIEQGLSFAIFPLLFMIASPTPLLYRSLLKVSLYAFLGIALIFLFSFGIYAHQHEFLFPECLSVIKGHYSSYLNYPIIDHPTVFSMNIGMGVALVFCCFMSGKQRWFSGFAQLIPVLLFCLAMFFSSSRAGQLVSIVLFLAVLIFSIPVRFWMQALLFVMLAGAASFYLLCANEEVSERMNDIYRDQMMQDSKQRIKEHWAWGQGVGLMSFDVYNDAEKSVLIGNYNTPHNQYLTEVLRFGVFGALPFFLILLSVLARAVIGKPRYGLLIWLLIYVPMMWIETPFESAATVIPMVFWLCFFFSQEEDKWTSGLLSKKRNNS